MAKTVVIKSGVLNTFLYDIYTARKDNTLSTGNAVRASYESSPRVGLSNFYIKPSNNTFEELIGCVDKGFYVMDIIGLHSGTNPISGEISVGAKGIWISKGSLEFPVKEVTIATDVLSLCKSIDKIGSDLIKSLVDKEIERKKFKEKIIESLKESLTEILSVPKINLEEIISKAKNENRAATFIFFGINGVGKSLSIAKFANFLSKKGYKVILAAGDTFRAAGDIQLEKYALALNLPIIKHKRGADPAAVIFDARKAAEARKYDVVLADTSGRIHTKRDLLDELQKIVRVNKPDLKILVLDSLSGSDVINQFEFFDEAVGIDAVVFTKVDVNEKGGNILSVCYKFKKPILFLGKGQNFDDMEEFDSQRFVNNLIGDLKI